jgi:two-component system, LytTR family, sensor histidine kinase AlgZ
MLAKDLPGRLRFAAIVVAAWTLVALAWTPPTILVQTAFGTPSVVMSGAQVFLNVLCSFVPWMVATPLIFLLGRRFPVSEGHIARALLVHVLAGVAIVPIVTGVGVVLSRVVLEPHTIRSLPSLLGAVLITAFYSVPTYVAVVAVGQALGYFERYRARERLLARAELRALEAQLNPHFLFNTLNAISALGYRDARLADEALTRLAGLLRLTLSERPERIALKDEVAFAKEYAELQALLAPFAFDIAVAPEAWNALVPAMLLQPLLENAILHGRRGGRVALSARRDGGMLVLRLVNGVTEAVTAATSGGGGIGLANTRERLRVIYGDDASLGFTRGAADAAVEIALPFREAET